MRRLLVIMMAVVAVGAAVLAVTGAPEPAKAQGPYPSKRLGKLRPYCLGTRLESHKLRNRRGKLVGRTELWYSPINGGENCVMTYNTGGRPWTAAWIARLTHKGGRADEEAEDASNYEYYAGGAYVDHTNGHCVIWAGLVNDHGYTSRPGGVHCG